MTDFCCRVELNGFSMHAGVRHAQHVVLCSKACCTYIMCFRATHVSVCCVWRCNTSSTEEKQWNVINKMDRWVLRGLGKILTKCVSLCHLSQPPSSQAPWLHEDYKCFMSVCLKPTASIWLPLSPFIPESQWSTTGPPQARGPGVGAGTQRRRECCSWSVLQIAFLIQADTE